MNDAFIAPKKFCAVMFCVAFKLPVTLIVDIFDTDPFLISCKAVE